MSDTSNPLGAWHTFTWTFAGKVPFSPYLGLSGDKLAVGFDAIPLESCSFDPFERVSAGTGLIAVDRSTLVAMPDSLPNWASAIDATKWGWRPATNVGAGNDIHLVARNASNQKLVFATLRGTKAAGGPTLTAAAGPDLTYWDADGALDGMVRTAVWRNNTLYLAADTQCGTGGAWNCMRVTELTTSGDAVTLLADRWLGDDDLSGLNARTFGGSLGVSADGTVYVVYSHRAQLDDGTYLQGPVTTYVAYQSPSDAAGTFHGPVTLFGAANFGWPAAPVSFFGGVEWPTYGLLPPDPSDTASVWQGVPYADGSGWATRIGKLTAGTAGAPAGTWQIDGGASANEFLVDVVTTPGAGAGVTQVRVSNSGSLTDGVLASSRVFPSGGRLSWDLSEAAMGGTTATGTKTLYLQWGDGNGTWSAVESHTIAVSSVVGTALYSIAPTRILDSRSGNGLSGAFTSKVARSFQVTGRAGIPADAIAITGNVTVTGQTTAGHVTLAPTLTTGVDAPISTINFLVSPDNRANGMTVGLSNDGKLAVMFVGSTSTATAHVLFDVSGYYTRRPGAAAPSTMTYHPLATPVRVANTKTKLQFGGRLQGGSIYGFWVAGMPSIPENAIAVTGNVTVPKGATEGTHLTLTNDPATATSTSTINFKTTEERANNLTVPLGPWGALWVYYAAKPTSYSDFVFDVTGYFTADASGASYVPIAPARILDTRPRSTSRPNNPIGLSGPMTARKAYTFAVTGMGGVPASGPVAVTGNLTITGQTAVGQLIVGPTETTGVLPAWNSLSSPTGQNRANGIVTGLNGTGRLSIMYWASSTGYTSHAIFDVSGYFK